MPRNYILQSICLLVLLALIGCNNATKAEPDLNACNVTEHQWYQDVLAGAEDGILHKVSTIYRYTYKGDYYFEVENAAFSCMHCYIYDCDGNLAEFANSAEATTFVDNRTDRVVIWAWNDEP